MTYNELVKLSREKYYLDDKTSKYLINCCFEIEEIDKINNIKINSDELKSYEEKAELIRKGVPIQYVLENVNFYGYNFYVKKGVLIPRFETEELVYNIKNYILKYFDGDISLIDIGTGSGAIGISLKKELPNLDITLTDISDTALEVAKYNAKKLGAVVDIYKSDMLKKVIKKSKKYDVLISNPPYLKEDEEIMDVVKHNEPKIALYGGKDGLKYYDEILKNAKAILKDKAIIAFEIGSDQEKDLIRLTNAYFKNAKYIVKKDMQGRNRMFFIFL